MRKFHPLAVEAMRQGKRIYHLNIGQPDISTPQAFFDAIRESQPRVLEYAASAGVPELLAAVQGYYGRLGVALQEDDILITNGGSEALLMLMLSILDEGDEIIVPEPFYPNYTTFIHAAGGVVCPVPTKPEEGYRYADREKFESRINERTRAILLTTPGNPTGVALTREEMTMFKDLAKEHNLYLICDEVYREFAYETDELLTMLSFADAAHMEEYLDILPGAVSVMGLMNDHGGRVRLLIDREVTNAPYVGCHPCVNTSSLRIRTEDLLGRFLPHVGHAPSFVTL